MIYLLDVNALIALGFASHEFHVRVSRWIDAGGQTMRLATTPITELGFIRVLPQLGDYDITVHDAIQLLTKLKSSKRPGFHFLPDDQSVEHLPRWVKSAKQTTDGHLLQLADRNQVLLATLDERLPGSHLIPRLSGG
jgi:predicted nucleic acid-binding protein